jgi:hypothetical protein
MDFLTLRCFFSSILSLWSLYQISAFTLELNILYRVAFFSAGLVCAVELCRGFELKELRE